MFDFYNDNDRKLEEMLPRFTFLENVDPYAAKADPRVTVSAVSMPDEKYRFLHEAAVISFGGVLFAAWYNNPIHELSGDTPIRGARSFDGGKTWTEPFVIASDEKLLYCPPVFGIDGGKLYLFMNEMVSADHIHALDLYVWNEKTEKFDLLWSRPIPFKLNTNVYRLNNGKLMLPGRIAELDGFPNTPAVLISDSGKPDAEWRLVKIEENGALPDGAKLVHPEMTAIVTEKRVWMFGRDDERKVPLVWYSDDDCETWSGMCAHDIPFSDSKIYSGTLSDGRNYLIGNLYPARRRLALFLSKKGEMVFDRAVMLANGSNEWESAVAWHYPVAFEADGKLYVICTLSLDKEGCERISHWGERETARAAALFTVPLDL